MIQRTWQHPGNPPHASTASQLVALSSLLLASLVMADRLIAWMIGLFPTSAALWQLRFEYLRPIGVFHDIAAMNLGNVSVVAFNVLVALLALLVGLGAVSRIRLARAVACHVLLAAAAVLAVYSIDPGAGVYARVGVPSQGYVLLGLVLAAPAAFMCASVHAEYAGWRFGASRAGRGLRRLRLRVQERILDLAGEAIAVGKDRALQAIPVQTRAENRASTQR